MGFKFRFPVGQKKCKNNSCCTTRTVCCEACPDVSQELTFQWPNQTSAGGSVVLPSGFYTLNLQCGKPAIPPCSRQETVSAFGCVWQGTFPGGNFVDSNLKSWPTTIGFTYSQAECFDEVRSFRFNFAFLEAVVVCNAWFVANSACDGFTSGNACDAIAWAWYGSELPAGYSDGWTYNQWPCSNWTGAGYVNPPTSASPLMPQLCVTGASLFQMADSSQIKVGSCSPIGCAYMVGGAIFCCDPPPYIDLPCQEGFGCGCQVSNCVTSPPLTNLPNQVDV